MSCVSIMITMNRLVMILLVILIAFINNIVISLHHYGIHSNDGIWNNPIIPPGNMPSRSIHI